VGSSDYLAVQAAKT